MIFQAVILVPFILALLASYYLGFTPPLIGVLFILLSLISYYKYAKDKQAAVNGEWRVSENTLHFFDVLGGWPGALIAQSKFRHKTKKSSFRIVFWLSVLANISGYAWLHIPQGNSQLHVVMNELRSHVNSYISNTEIRSSINVLTHFRTDTQNHNNCRLLVVTNSRVICRE